MLLAGWCLLCSQRKKLTKKSQENLKNKIQKVVESEK